MCFHRRQPLTAKVSNLVLLKVAIDKHLNETVVIQYIMRREQLEHFTVGYLLKRENENLWKKCQHRSGYIPVEIAKCWAARSSTLIGKPVCRRFCLSELDLISSSFCHVWNHSISADVSCTKLFCFCRISVHRPCKLVVLWVRCRWLFQFSGSQWHMGVLPHLVRRLLLCDIPQDPVWRKHLQVWRWKIWGLSTLLHETISCIL